MTWTGTVPDFSVIEDLLAADLETIADVLTALTDPWTAYAVAWQATGTAPAVGNGSLTGSYIQVGKFIVGRIRLVAGTTSTFGTGGYNFTLPAALASAAQWEAIGSCSVRDDSGAASYGLSAMSASSTVVSAATSAGGRLGATVPFTMTFNDIISISFCYEAA